MEGKRNLDKMQAKFFKAPVEIFYLGLSPYSILVFLFMVSHQENFNPSNAYTSKQLKLHRKTIKKGIDELLNQHVISLVQRGARGHVAKYVVLDPKGWKSI